MTINRISLLAAIVESAQDAVLAKTLDGIITFWNPAAERMLGYNEAEAIGMSIFSLVPYDRRSEEDRFLYELRQGKRIEPYESVRVRKDGTKLQVSLSLSPIRAADGSIAGVATIARDITARKLEEERFQIAVEAAPNGMIMVGADGTIVHTNTEAERLFGYSKEEMLGKTVEMLVPTRFQEKHPSSRTSFFAAPAKRAMGVGRDLYAQRKDGKEVSVEIGLNPIETSEGTFVLAAIVDITERKLAAEEIAKRALELERSNSELEQFAYVASHDLQEPLRMVVSFTELFEQRYKGKFDEKSEKYLRYIVEGGKRMQELVDDLLSYSRLDRRRKALQRVDMSTLVKSVLRSLGSAIIRSGAKVECSELPTVLADEVQMGQVFQNLVDNAIKFRRDEPVKIFISANLLENEWQFCVEDNGIGIEMQYAERVFQMFQRLHARGRYEGSGMGLAVVKKIVERHGGRIWFESQIGKGTKFYFTIPAKL